MPLKQSAQRISVIEYGSPKSFAVYARRLGISIETLRMHFERVSGRIASTLGVQSAIIFGDGTFQVAKIAGILRLTPGLDLEICPKFLSSGGSSWREDFFCIAAISRYGRVLPREELASSAGDRGDLADLLARAMTWMHDQNWRRPLRTYRRRAWQSLEIDGEVEPESLFLTDDDGFLQQGLVLDRENPFNRVILLGMSTLLPEIRDGDTRRKLVHHLLKLFPQRDLQKIRPQILPARHRRWQDLYDLSSQICLGFGLAYGDLGRGPLPGFLIRTAEAWEALILTALRIGMSDRRVTKKLHPFGTQDRIGRKPLALSIEPDITIEESGSPTLIIDAKYKTLTDFGRQDQGTMSRSDIYEAIAFLQAVRCKRAILIYPATERLGTSLTPGSSGAFERVNFGSLEVIGMSVDPVGIAAPGGFGNFCRSLAQNVRAWAN